MNRSKKNLRPILWLTAIAFVMLMGGMAYAADQTVVLNPSTATLSQSDNLDITVNYNCPEKVDTFSVVLCYDSTKLTLLDPPVTNIFGDAGLIEAYDDTVDNNDGDAATDKYVSLFYMGTFNPATFEFAKDWPQADVPLDVITVHFQVNATVADGTVTKVNVVDKGEIGTFTGTGSEITVGPVTEEATPLTVAEADADAFWTTPGLMIVDVAPADAYAAGRITGAGTLADVAAITDKNTPILVYCREAANAKTEADALVADSFTDVYYLNDTFDAWVAEVNPTKVEYKLTITVAGAGNGSVTANANPIADSAWFVKDTEVALVGTPDDAAISQFDGFTGGTTTDTITMDASKTVTATFSLKGTPVCADVLQSVALTTADPTTGDAPLTVNLTATVTGTADGYEWTVKDTAGNDIAGYPQTTATNIFTVSALAAGSYTAIVTASNSAIADCSVESVALPITANDPGVDQYTLTLNVDPAVGGTAVATPAQATYAAGTIVDIAATPKAGYKFTTWSGNVVAQPNEAVTTITMDGNKDVTANFELIPADEYTLTVNASAGGSVEAIPAQVSYVKDTVVTVKATADQGYKFVSWTGDVADANAAATTVAMDADKTVMANFIEDNVVTPDGNGNGDDYTDIYDALLAAMYDVETDPAIRANYEAMPNFWMLDVDQSNAVDINDALAIARYDVGMTCTCTLDQ